MSNVCDYTVIHSGSTNAIDKWIHKTTTTCTRTTSRDASAAAVVESSSSSSTTPLLSGEQEVRWIESEQTKTVKSGHHKGQQDSGDDDNDDDTSSSSSSSSSMDPLQGLSNLFVDPDPLDVFRFRYDDVAASSSTSNRSAIEIVLSGHKAELGQTLHSTGLTLWRASEFLCEFLLQQQRRRRRRRRRRQQEEGAAAAAAAQPSRGNNDSNDDNITTPTNYRSVVWIQDKDILELGAGLGLCGILAHRLGARRVLLTDGDTDTLTNLRTNVQANMNTTNTMNNNNNNQQEVVVGSVSCHQLVWGTKQLDDFHARHGKFDIILGADIIYVENAIDPLWRTVAQLLKPQGGVFLLAFARRNVSVDLVFQAASKYGFVWEAPSTTLEGVYVFYKRLETGSEGCDDMYE